MPNTSREPYRSSAVWTPQRPETLVVCCSDGRWHAPIVEFVDHEVSDRADLYAVPGGPAEFDPWNSSFEETRVLQRAFQLFEEHHALFTTIEAGGASAESPLLASTPLY